MALLERMPALGAARDYMNAALAGNGRLVFIGGEAGVGKTSFVEQVVADAGSVLRVARGTCDGSSTPAPLGPLREMLPALPPDVWPPEADRAEVFTRLSGALGRPGTTYLLVVEDAHWSDDATLDLVRHLARRVHHLRALVLVTFRSEQTVAGHPLRVLFGDVAGASGVRRIDLNPLTRDGVRMLLEEHAQAGGPAEDPAYDADELHRITGGNPFFVTEVVAGGGGSLPRSVREAVLSRVARLSAPAREVLDLVALGGPRCEVALVDDIAAELTPALDEGLAHGVLLLSGDDVLTFRHELARLTVRDEIPALRRRLLHRQVLEWLERNGGDAARMAHHAEAAGLGTVAARHAVAAAERAARLGSHAQAAAQYERALRHDDDFGTAELADLHGRHSFELYVTGDMQRAFEERRRAHALWQELGDVLNTGDAERWLSRLSWFSGRGEVAHEYGARAYATLRGSGSVAEAMAASNQAQLCMLNFDLDGTRRWTAETMAVLDALPPGPDVEEVRLHALNNRGTVEVDHGDAELGWALLEESRRRSQEADLHEHAARAYTNQVAQAVETHLHARLEGLLGEALAYCSERDLDAWLLYMQGWEALHLLDVGHSAEAARLAASVLRHPRTATVTRINPLSALARAQARLGRPESAQTLAEALELARGTREAQRMCIATAAACEVAWITGHDEECTARAKEGWEVVSAVESPWTRGMVATWLPDDEAAAVADTLPAPLRLEALRQWDAAAEAWEDLGSSYPAALARARAGTRDGLSRAAVRFDELGDEAAADRARARARAQGWSTPRGQRRTTRAHPHGLTRRESEVAELIALGMSNAAIADRLVLSTRTVEHHVAAVMAKLDVSSRHAVRDALGHL